MKNLQPSLTDRCKIQLADQRKISRSKILKHSWPKMKSSHTRVVKSSGRAQMRRAPQEKATSLPTDKEKQRPLCLCAGGVWRSQNAVNFYMRVARNSPVIVRCTKFHLFPNIEGGLQNATRSRKRMKHEEKYTRRWMRERGHDDTRL